MICKYDHQMSFGFFASDSHNQNQTELQLAPEDIDLNNLLFNFESWAVPGKLTSKLVDLLQISTEVYACDRLCRRDRVHADYGWARSISLSIQVYDFEFWSRTEVSAILRDCLNFLSGDFWDITFVPSNNTFEMGQFFSFPKLKPLGDDPAVCLCSGGLDSAAGLIRRLNEYGHQNIIPVLVAHQTGQGPLVQNQIDLINERMGICLKPRIFPFQMTKPKKLGCSEENSQRSRSFLFCAAAGVKAAMVEARSIEMMECGIGSINLPLMEGMVGSKATRGSHPTFLKRFSHLLQLVTDREICVQVPHQYLTEAELVRSLTESGLEELAAHTVSCVHYPLRDKKAKQCGVCPACIFRRQALMVAGINEENGIYEYDLFSRESGDIPEEKLIDLKAFLLQIGKLSSLEYSNRLPQFAEQHLRATEVVLDEPVPDEIVGMYQRYTREWMSLVERGLGEKWKWAQMMAPAVA